MSDESEATPIDAGAEIDAAVASDGAYTLVVAEFPDVSAAREAYDELKQYTEDNRLDIEGVIVLSKDQDGNVEVQKATDYRTKRGLAWGVVGGVVLGVLFPPSIIGSAVVLGAAGAGVGRLRHLHYSQEFADELAESIDPGHSGIVALVSDPTELELERALAKADRIVSKAVDKAVAEDLKAEARAAETPGGASTGQSASS
jgi:uncharacterized membrane protein